MAKTLKLKMVAEGIETSKQESGYASMACTTVRAGSTARHSERSFLTLGRATFVNFWADGRRTARHATYSSMIDSNPP